jgi:hypothetical protein
VKQFFLFLVLLPFQSFAGVSEDFEKGSGGLKAEWLDIAAQSFVFLAMFVLVMWVLQSSLKQLVKADDGDGYSIFALSVRSVFLCVLVILTLT